MTVAAVVMSTTQAQLKKKRRQNKKEAAAEEKARQEAADEKAREEAAAPPKPWFVKIMMRVLDVLNSLTLQTCLYITFVVIFQNLANTMRLRQEVRFLCGACGLLPTRCCWHHRPLGRLRGPHQRRLPPLARVIPRLL